MTHVRTAALSLAFVCALVAGPAGPAAPARAESATGALYADLRQVIEELIRSEITRNVVRVIEARSPGLAFYFRRTLERLASPYWGNLGATLGADLVGLTGDYVFWTVSGAAAGGDAGRRLHRFFACFEPARAGEPDCAAVAAMRAGRHRTLVDAVCRSEKTRTTPEQRVACDLALATRAGLERKVSMAMRHVIDSVTDILLHDVPAGPLERRLRLVAQSWLKDAASYPAAFPDLFLGAELRPDRVTVEWIQALCKDADQLRGFFAAPDASAAWVCFAVSYAGLPNALAFRLELKHPDGGTIKALLRYWQVVELLEALDAADAEDRRPREQRLYSMFVDAAIAEHCARNTDLRPARPASPAGRVGGAIDSVTGGAQPVPVVDRASDRGGGDGLPDSPIECRDKKLVAAHPVGATITVNWLGLSMAARAIPTGFKADTPLALARAMKSFQVAMRRVAVMRQTVPGELRELLFVEDRVAIEPSALALRSLLRIGQLVGELRSRWYLWPNEPELAAEGRLAGINLGGLLGLALEICAPSIQAAAGRARSLARIRRLLERGEGLTLRRVLDLSFRAETRELAVEGMRVALGLRHRGRSAERPYETFFISMSGYMLDGAASEGGEVTREAFRAAAKDLLLTLPSDGVPSARERVRLRALPLLGLRASFNSHYQSESGRDGMRVLASADWPVLYVALRDHAGVRVSALDLLAPLSELALREVADWSGEGRVLADLVRPRIGVWLAAPELSRRLLLEAGAGLRLVGTELDDEDGADPRGRYTWDRSVELHLGLSFAL